jgi:hypothetical protein
VSARLAGVLGAVVAIGLVAAFVVANVQEGDAPSRPTTTLPSAAPYLDLVAGDLRSGADATFVVTYVNPTPVTVTFGSSQDADISLLRGAQEVWHWSDGRAFSQVVRTVRFPPGRHQFTLNGRLTGVPAGRYTAVATLAGRPAPPPARLSVVVG